MLSALIIARRETILLVDEMEAIQGRLALVIDEVRTVDEVEGGFLSASQ